MREKLKQKLNNLLAKGESSRPTTPVIPSADNHNFKEEIEDTKQNELEIESFGLLVFDQDPEPQTYDVDIIAVHGLGGHREKTWTQDGRLWLRDFLPAQLQENDDDKICARIMTYGYNSRTVFTKATTGVDDQAKAFLNALSGRRRGSEKRRPIVLIAHSLGGLVVKKAMIYAHARADQYGDLSQSFKGIVFLGVPHRGADIAWWGDPPVKLIKALSLGSFGNDINLSLLKKESDKLGEMADEWTERTKKLDIVSFGEEEKLANILVVPKYSAYLNLPNEKSVILPGCNHSTICKFSDRASERYRPVWIAVHDLCISATDTRKVARKTLTEEESRCLRKLKTSDYEFHRQRNLGRVPGTCNWCLNDDVFQNWKEEQSSSFIWITADPGCGKSFLASFLVDHLGSAESQAVLPGDICFFFFKDDSDEQRSVEPAICALLHQLSAKNSDRIEPSLTESERNPEFTKEFHALWRVFWPQLLDFRIQYAS